MARLARKLPEAVDRTMPFSNLLAALLRVRSDKEFWQCLPFRRLLKRGVHLFSQAVDARLSEYLREDCPSPDLAAKYHPYMRSSWHDQQVYGSWRRLCECKRGDTAQRPGPRLAQVSPCPENLSRICREVIDEAG